MNIPIVNLNGGEFTSHLDARSDTEKYSSGCRHLENMIPRIYGPVERRPGTIYISGGIDLNTILPSIIAWENIGSCYINSVVSTLPDSALMPMFVCYQNDMVCFENESVVSFETAVLADDIVCLENNVIFYENEITIFN